MYRYCSKIWYNYIEVKSVTDFTGPDHDLVITKFSTDELSDTKLAHGTSAVRAHGIS
jgi:hypothetical protein